jgi:hypothetical protein
MTMCAMSIIAGFLTSGCQKGSSLEQFSKQISSAKSIRAEATLKLGSKTRPVSILRKLPNQAKTTSEELIALVNDQDGWLEVDGNANKYATIPWGGKFFAGIGKLVDPPVTACLLAYGVTPLQIAPAKDWKLKMAGGNEVWTTFVQTQAGPQKFEFELSTEGELKRFLGPSGEFMISKWELNPPLQDSDFTVRVPDGYVMSFLPTEPMSLFNGQVLDFSKMKKNNSKKLGDNWSLVLFSDTADPISAGMRSWLSKTQLGAAKVEVSLGAGGDYSVTDEKAFWVMVSATPTCALVNKKGVVCALWQGFDATQTARLEKEIAQAMKEHS